ncbi:MAG: hypothetical protein AAF559_07835 [Pseudomonadota bacterium]
MKRQWRLNFLVLHPLRSQVQQSGSLSLWQSCQLRLKNRRWRARAYAASKLIVISLVVCATIIVGRACVHIPVIVTIEQAILGQHGLAWKCQRGGDAECDGRGNKQCILNDLPLGALRKIRALGTLTHGTRISG